MQYMRPAISAMNRDVVIRRCLTIVLDTKMIKFPTSTGKQSYLEDFRVDDYTIMKYSDTSANEDNSFRNHIR